MTDIDALIEEARQSAKFLRDDFEMFGHAALMDDLAAALTAERAKVAALEAEAARWREVAGELAGALNTAHNGLKWYRAECPQFVNGSDYEADEIIDAALTRFKQESGE